MFAGVLLFILWFATTLCFVVYVYFDIKKDNEQHSFNKSIKTLTDSLKENQDKQMCMIETLSQLYFDKKEETYVKDNKESKSGRVRKSNTGSNN